MKPGREVIEVNFGELTALLERARQEPLGEADCQRLQGAIQALNYLIEMIGDKDTTISRLRALLAKPSTEKTRKVLEQAGVGATPPGHSSPPPGATPSGQKPKPGHGRNGAAAYRGANRVKIAHPSLKSGDRCPRCFKGQGLRTEGAGPAHPGGGSGAPGGHRL
jgi:transposase